MPLKGFYSGTAPYSLRIKYASGTKKNHFKSLLCNVLCSDLSNDWPGAV